jgi:hypothetical protein
MSEIQRYAVIETALCIGGNVHDGEVFMVRADEHDRELAALREELAKVIEDRARFPDRPDFIGNMISAHIGNLKARAVSAEKYSRMWADKVTAAEQRNAELVELTKDALKAFNYHPEGSCYNPGIAFVKPWSIRAAELIKPAESGASE